MTDYTSQINAIFQAIQFQAGSAMEVAAYNAGLNSGALTLTSLAALIEQQAYTLNVVNPVIREYQAAFGRVPDQTGLAYWVDEIGANPSALAVLNTTFANSSEFNARYGANATTRANLGLVVELYENVLGRQPDSAGLTYWVNSGLDAAQLLQVFAQSAEFISNTASAVTTYENLGAGGTPPTAGSLLGLGSAGGQYFTLTTGVDNLSLTANNNTINGTFGSLNATLTAGDSINGGTTAGNVLDLVDLGTGGAGNPTTVGANSISDIQTVNVVSSEAINANAASSSAGFFGLTQLNVTESSNNASSTITAAATTNISVIDQSQMNGGVVSVQGGLVISIAVAEVSSVTGGSVIVGSSTAPAIGTVEITATAQPAAPGNFQMGSITVYGGTIDSITQDEAGFAGFTTTGGTISVYGGAATTSVTVDQTAPAAPSASTAGVVDGAVNIKDVNEAGGGAGVITTVSLDGLNGASNIYDNALTNLTVNDSFIGTSVAIVEGASTSATILALSINNDPGLTLDDVGNKYATVNVTIGAQASSLTIDDTALTTLTIFGPSGLLGPAGSLVITTNATALSTINAAADTGALTVLTTAAGLTIVGGTDGDSITNWSPNGVITEGATPATLHNTLAVYGALATINDQASAGVDEITLGGVNETANLGSGGTAAASTTVNVSNAPSAAMVVDRVNFGSGIATVTDHLAYQAVAGASSSNTDGNLLALAGTLHGEILAFSSAVANTAGALGAAANVTAAANLDQAVFLVEEAAAAANTVAWFQFEGNTYIEDSGTNPTANGTAGAELVKITGTVDLSHATIGGGHLTFA